MGKHLRKVHFEDRKW